jgi:hypothetical protein
MSVCRGMRLRCGFRAANRDGIGSPDVGEEAIAAASNSFDEAGTFGRVAERLTDLVDRLLSPWSKSTNVSAGQSFF